VLPRGPLQELAGAELLDPAATAVTRRLGNRLECSSTTRLGARSERAERLSFGVVALVEA
jgi:hypothetical protein